MPPSSLLRPLPVDVIIFAVPLFFGVGAFLLGRFFHRWSLAVRTCLVVLTLVAVALAWGNLFHTLPLPLEIAFSHFGGVIIVLCWIVLGVIGMSWASPNPSTDWTVRIMIALVPLGLIAVESGGSLWFRYQSPESWNNRPSEVGLMTQSTRKTCLPVAAAMLLHEYGVNNASEGELAYLANTSFFGTDNNVMARAITRKLGKRGARASTIHADYDEMVERGLPFIAQVQLENVGNHAVFVRSINPHLVIWVDPMSGTEQAILPDLFRLVWTGHAIVIDGASPKPDSLANSK